jgi:hypothetical protein
MVEEEQNRRWDHTASILAMIAEVHRDKKRTPKAYTPSRFHPGRRKSKKETPVETVDLKVLKTIFVDRKPLQ